MPKRKLLVFSNSDKAWAKALIAMIPFAIVIIAYLIASDARLSVNPQDKLLPSIGQMLEAIERMAFTADRRSGDYLLWTDTLASLQRLLLGVGLSAFTALFIGLNMGVFSRAEQLGKTFITTISMIPPLAVLPILFISFGVGELGKVALIYIGTFPLFARDMFLSAKSIPKEQVVKSMTLGASPAGIAYQIVLPQIMPRLLQSVRLGLGSAWLFLIAAEAISSTDGLGYRIFLLRRYLSMDAILVYVAWITFLGFFLDYLLRKLSSWKYPWFDKVQ